MPSSMKLARLVLNFVVVGALLGVLAVSLLGPTYIQWDTTGGSGSDPRCLCAETARQGADRIIHYQMLGLAAGAGLGLVAGIALGIVRRKKAPAEAPPAS